MATSPHDGLLPLAARGFAAAAGTYERGRPGYPEAAVQWLSARLRLGPAVRVADVGAGTGKLTRALAELHVQLTAIEPVAEMRAVLQHALPFVTVLDGTAEALPLTDASVDAVTVAQAFHWFDGERALAELHRVLVPRGRLGLVWNARDDSVDWVTRLTELLDRHDPDAPRYKSGKWREAFERTSLFTRLEQAHFVHAQPATPDILVARVASVSYVAALDPAGRDEVLAEARALLATHPETRGRSQLSIPYRTDAFACERR